MARKWIDFKKLKETLDFAQVLEHYGVDFKANGDQATGRCPLPTHDGDSKSKSFSAELKKGIWQCFSPRCQAKGNVLDFAVRMEELSPDNPQDVREVALKLWERFGSGGDDEPDSKRKRSPKSRRRGKTSPEDGSHDSGTESADSGAVVVNQPLDFELKGLDARHPYLRGRGLSPQTIERFGLGFCSRGMLKGRVAIPIHDEDDRLVGYAGRLVDDERVSKANPKYKFPPARERGGVVHEFHKSQIVYNANRILAPAMSLVVVEGFASVWWLYQWGFKDAMALMGSDCSLEQAHIIVSKVPPDGQVLIMPDGNEAGRLCALSVFETVGTERAVRWVRLDDDHQPTDYQSDDLFRMLSME